MQRYTRIVFGLNAVYQLALGFLCLFAPVVAISMHGGNGTEHDSTLLAVTFRMIGVNLVPIGVMSALLAFNAEAYGVLRQIMGLIAVLKLVGWGIAVSAHDLGLSQIASSLMDVIMQLLILVEVVGYYPRARMRQIVVRRRAA